MISQRLNLIIATATALILIVIAATTVVTLQNSENTALNGGELSMERNAQAVEKALNRQLLQVHGALASLPSLFDAAQATPMDTQVADKLLRGLNFQTLAYRELMLVDAQGTILAAARARGDLRRLPFDARQLDGIQTTLIGPLRNQLTGNWSLYVARSIAQWTGITAVAEVPIPTLMDLLAEVGLSPDISLQLELPDGRLIGSRPHDEMAMGTVRPEGLGRLAPTGQGFIVTNPRDQSELVAVVRSSLFGDIRVVLTQPVASILAEWQHDSAGIIGSAILASLLIATCAGGLILLVWQREKVEAERERSKTTLVNAIEAMSEGFVMWDAQDRLVTCNQRYRDLYAISSPLMVPGTTYAEIVRKGAELGQYPEAGDDIDAFVETMVALHRHDQSAVERRLPDGRWVLMRERRTADGGFVGVRTDITLFKTMLAELEEANSRANEAVAEAQRQNAALTQRESQIRYLAHHDELTGLPNRVLFRECIPEMHEAAVAAGEQFAVLYLDLDRFKDVNDTLGHPTGDALLRAVASRLSNCVDAPNRLARLGGDEFAIISVAPCQPEAAEQLSARIIEEIGRPYYILGHTIAISASVGIAVADGAGNDADSLLKRADLALYQAKAMGRSTWCVFAPGMDQRLRDRLALESDLLHALPLGQLGLLYQPLYELATERLSGFEALLRWQHPERGAISPDIFIPLAEETRIIVDIGKWVLRQACADLAAMPNAPRIGINLSPVQLGFGDFVGSVEEVLRDTGLDPARLELEITETALFANDPRNLEVLARLKRLGVRIVLDDFGTGYSSLSHLRLFPLDKIKIDRLFVRDMAVRADSAVIVEAVATLAARLGMTTTAEGIETDEQLAAARRAGCTEGQGYLLGRPLPLECALALASAPLRERNPAEEG